MAKRRKSKAKKNNIYYIFNELILSDKYIEALEILKKEQTLTEGVPLDNMDGIVPKVRGWLPEVQNVEKFCDFVDGLFYIKKEMSLAINLAYGLVRIFPEEFAANHLAGKFFADRKLLHYAEFFLKNALRINPNNCETNILYGNLLAAKQDYEGAANYFKQAISINPLDPRAQYNLALAYKFQGDVEKYERFIEEALRIEPNYVLALVNLAQHELITKKNMNKFIEIKKKVHEIDPNTPLNSLLEYLHDNYLGKNGEKYLNRFVKSAQRAGMPPLDITIPYKPGEDTEKIDEILEKISEIKEFGRKEENWFYLSNKGIVLLEKGMYVEAAKMLKSALEINPSHVLTNYKYITTLLFLRDLDKAEQLCNHLLKISPHSLSARNFLSSILMRKGKVPEAIELLNQVLTKDAENVDASYLMASCLFKQKKYDQAEKFSYIVLKKKNEFNVFLHGKILFAQNQSEKALNYFDIFISLLDPKSDSFYGIGASANYLRAHAYFRLGKIKNAIRILKNTKEKSSSEFYLNDLSVFYAKNKNILCALWYSRKAIKIRPNYQTSLSNYKKLKQIIKARLLFYLIMACLVAVDFFLCCRNKYLLAVALLIIIIVVVYSKKIKPAINIPLGETSLSFSLGEYDFSQEDKYSSLALSIDESDILK